MDAVEGLGTTVLAAVTAETAETLLAESDCSTGDEQKKKGREATKKKKIKIHTLRQINIFRSNTLLLQHKV